MNIVLRAWLFERFLDKGLRLDAWQFVCEFVWWPFGLRSQVEDFWFRLQAYKLGFWFWIRLQDFCLFEAGQGFIQVFKRLEVWWFCLSLKTGFRLLFDRLLACLNFVSVCMFKAMALLVVWTVLKQVRGFSSLMASFGFGGRPLLVLLQFESFWLFLFRYYAPFYCSITVCFYIPQA